MRTLAILALAALLSGCTASSESADTDGLVQAGDDNPEVSADGATANGAQAAATAKTVYAESEWGSVPVIFAVTGAYFQVDVPEGAANATVVFDADNAAFTTISASLEGCGEAVQDTSAVGPQGLRFGMKLCDNPEPGRHQVDLEVTGAFRGRVSVTGWAPL